MRSSTPRTRSSSRCTIRSKGRPSALDEQPPSGAGCSQRNSASIPHSTNAAAATVAGNTRCAKSFRVRTRASRASMKSKRRRRPSGVCGARLCDCRKIASGDPRLQVMPDSVRCFAVAPFDVLALPFGGCGHAGTGSGWPGHSVSLAYDLSLEQRRVLPRENFSGNLPECLIRLRDRIAVAGSQPKAVSHLCRRVIGHFVGGRAWRDCLDDRRRIRCAGGEQNAGCGDGGASYRPNQHGLDHRTFSGSSHPTRAAYITGS
jgi:hypothetical protein